MYAINNNLEIVWKRLFEYKGNWTSPYIWEDAQGVNLAPFFFINIYEKLFCLDQATGEIIWEKSFASTISKKCIWQDKILVLTEHKLTKAPTHETKTTLYLLDTKDGSILWQHEEMMSYTNAPSHFGILNDHVLWRLHQGYYQIIDLKTGRLVADKQVSKRMTSKLHFEHLVDAATGQHYLIDRDGTIYW